MLHLRTAALSACVGLSLFLVLIQSGTGFGLENALRSKIRLEFAAEKKQASTPEEFQKVYMNIAAEHAKYPMTATTVLQAW